jgi:NAD(P)-dependent dehydrogenase (short-subunit alcohol dehydrogenase family)
MGVDIVRAALAAGHAVVATGRHTDAVASALGQADGLLVVKLDVTRPEDATAAVAAAVNRFGRIDVLVNNAGNFYAGFFEEISPEDFRAQIETNLFGPVNVTRAVLPVMRAQRRGLIVTISSTGGISGQAFVSAYSAAKFGVEGWIESLAPEVAPFGIRTMLVEPGFFRTELLTDESTKWPEASIDDYAEKTRQTVTAWKKMNGLQGGDPAKLAKAMITLAGSDQPRCAGPPAPTPSRPSRRRPMTWLPRPVPTGRCPRRLRTTTRATDTRHNLGLQPTARVSSCERSKE